MALSSSLELNRWHSHHLGNSMDGTLIIYGTQWMALSLSLKLNGWHSQSYLELKGWHSQLLWNLMDGTFIISKHKWMALSSSLELNRQSSHHCRNPRHISPFLWTNSCTSPAPLGKFPSTEVPLYFYPSASHLIHTLFLNMTILHWNFLEAHLFWALLQPTEPPARCWRCKTEFQRVRNIAVKFLKKFIRILKSFLTRLL